MTDKLTWLELEGLLGSQRAEDLQRQDREAAGVYTDMERRTIEMRNVRRLIREVRPEEHFDQLTGETEVERAGKKNG